MMLGTVRPAVPRLVTRMLNPPSSMRPCSKDDSQQGQRQAGDDLRGRKSFSELPGDRHGISANASETKPAELLTGFVVDTTETELTIPFGN